MYENGELGEVEPWSIHAAKRSTVSTPWAEMPMSLQFPDLLPTSTESCMSETAGSKRYPTLFERIGPSMADEGGGAGGLGIWNKVTGERLMGVERLKGVDALVACSKLVQDDFLMAREREDGHVYFVGGLVAFPGELVLSPLPLYFGWAQV